MSAIRVTTLETAAVRSPCVPVAAALLAGIGFGYAIEPARPATYLIATALVVGLSVVRTTQRGVRVGGLLMLYAVLGCGLQSAAWRDRGPRSITRVATGEARLVRLEGTLVGAPTIERRREAGRKGHGFWRTGREPQSICTA